MVESLLSQFVEEQQLQDARLLVAVSGGADSVALLRGLHGIGEQFNLRLIVGHYDHRLRSDSSEDARWVGRLCDRLGLERRIGPPPDACRELPLPGGNETPAAASSGPLPRPPAPGPLSTPHSPLPLAAPESPAASSRGVSAKAGSEEAARRSRYRFLQQVAAETGCRWIALAHTRDDQVETILHHIMRGSGLRGLQGMPQRRAFPGPLEIELMRPFLAVARDDLRAYLDLLGQEYRVDPTNQDLAFTRNRIRHQVLPFLREALNPQVDDALLRLADQARGGQAALEELAERLLSSSLLERRPERVRLDCAVLADQPGGLVREMFSILWRQQNWPRQGMSFEHFDQLARLAASPASQHSLPGRIEAVQRGGILVLLPPASR